MPEQILFNRTYLSCRKRILAGRTIIGSLFIPLLFSMFGKIKMYNDLITVHFLIPILNLSFRDISYVRYGKYGVWFFRKNEIFYHAFIRFLYNSDLEACIKLLKKKGVKVEI